MKQLRNITTKPLKAIFTCSVFAYHCLAHATADGPDFFQSKQNAKEISIYKKPELNSTRLKILETPIHGLRNLGCKEINSAGDQRELNDTGSLTTKSNIWCKVAYEEVSGWIENKYLTEDGSSKLPHFNCSATTTNSEVENTICNYQHLIQLDNQLNTTYNEALAKASGLDEGAKIAVNELKASQRGWIKGRNECWKATQSKLDCIQMNYEERIAYLQAKWRLVSEVSMHQYRCDDNNAELIVTIFNTKPLSANVEYGDKQDIFLKNDINNNTQFNGSFGKYIKLNNSGAYFQWDQAKKPFYCKDLGERT